MGRRLPPFIALIAFDAVARHLSFTAAAAELCITQSAVSQRIRLLEEFLLAPLFRRHPRRLEMTERALELAPAVQDILDRLERVLDHHSAYAAHVSLSICVEPSFAAKWLMPRLSEFFEEHSRIKCRIISSSDPGRLDSEDFDVSIRWGEPADWPGMHIVKFIDCEMFPVCHADLLQRGGGLVTPQDLRHVVLLRHSERNYWSEWLNQAGVDETDLNFGLEYDDDAMALEAALQAYGVCLTTNAVAGQELASGRLVRPFKEALRWNRSYYLVYRRAKIGQPKVMAFQTWLLRTGLNAVDPGTGDANHGDTLDPILKGHRTPSRQRG